MKSETCEFLRECGAFMLLTVDGNRPAGRPFGAVTEIDGDLYMSTGYDKAVYRQMMENENVQIVALKAGTRDWIRIDGVASECRELDKKKQTLNDCPNLLKYHRTADDPTFCLIRVAVKRSVLYTLGGARELNTLKNN